MNGAVVHIGRKISRLRELLGMKQETLAEKLGISQQAISKIEQSGHIDEATLEKIAKALSLTKEAIQNYKDDMILQWIQQHTVTDSSVTSAVNNSCTFNSFDEIKRLNDEKDELYKALLKEKDDKIALLEKTVRMLEKNYCSEPYQFYVQSIASPGMLCERYTTYHLN